MYCSYYDKGLFKNCLRFFLGQYILKNSTLFSTVKTYTCNVNTYLFLNACILTDNVALNKPAYQQYPLYPGDDTYDAINAVDGRKTNMSWYGGQCAVSASNKRTATWWVNLTSINSIHHINIYYIKGNAPWTHRKQKRTNKNPQEKLIYFECSF